MAVDHGFNYRHVSGGVYEDMKGYSKILAAMLVVTVLVYSFTPKYAEASPGAVVSFAAKQAAKAIVKSSVTRSVGNLALKEATEDLAKNYVKKEGFKLIVVEGGKKEMAKAVLTTVEKDALKKNIDNVIDLKVYGNAPSWVKFVDWFIGIGTVILIGELLYAAITGDAQDFLDEVFYEAMRMTGLLVPATPSPAPLEKGVPEPKDLPNPGSPSIPLNVDYKQTYDFNMLTNDYSKFENISGSSVYKFQTNIALKETVSQLSGMTYYVELAPKYPVNNVLTTLSINGLEVHGYNSNFGFYSGMPPGFSNMPADTTVTAYKNGTLVGTGQGNIDYNTWRTLLGSSFVYASGVSFTTQAMGYNRFIYTTPKVEGQRVTAYLKMTNTFTTVMPDLVIKYSTPAAKFNWSGNGSVSQLQLRYTAGLPMMSNGVRMRVGIYSDTEYLPELPLPVPGASEMPDTMSDLLQKNKKVALPQKSFLPNGYTYDPVDQVIRAPDGSVVTDPSTIPEKNPDPVVKTNPEGDPVIDDVPVPKGDTVPEPEPGTDGGEPTKPEDTGKPEDVNWKKLKVIPTLFTTKFPFSLPWDAKRAAVALFGDVPVVDEFKYTVKVPIGDGDPYKLDLSFPPIMDTFGNIFRTGLLIAFDIGLLYAVRKWFGGAS